MEGRPLQKLFSQQKPKKVGRVVKKRLADGTVKEYHYGAWKEPERPTKGDTMRALVRAYEASPEFATKAKATREQYLIYLRPWLEVADVLVTSIKRREIMEARDTIAKQRGQGAATAFVRVAGALFHWAIDREWIDANPASGIRRLPGGGNLTAWSDDQIDYALAYLREDLRRVVILGLYTGQRRGDLIAMTWAAYDGQTIRLRQAKTGTSLVLPVHPVLRAELEAWKAERVGVQILTTPKTGAWRTGNFLSHEMAKGLQKIGLPAGLNVHGLRHAAGRRLAEANCTVHEIQSITGHRSLAMVQLYTKSVNQERLAESAVSRLEIQKRTTGRKS